jgi:hypothetical protein
MRFCAADCAHTRYLAPSFPHFPARQVLGQPNRTSWHRVGIWHFAASMEYLIPAPDVPESKLYTRVIVRSADRDRQLFPQANSYEIALDDDINDVDTVELLSAHLPFTEYVVRPGRRAFKVNGERVAIAVGDYGRDGAALAAAVQGAVRASSPSLADATVAHDLRTDGFVLACSGTTLQLSFEDPESMHALLGFHEGGSYGPAEVIASPLRRTTGAGDEMIVTIDQFELNHCASSTSHRCFASFTREPPTYSNPRDACIKKYFNPPLARLGKLRITLQNAAGQPYDTQGQDHRLELLFVSSKTRRKYHPLAASELSTYHNLIGRGRGHTLST